MVANVRAGAARRTAARAARKPGAPIRAATSTSVALAAAYIERARSLREPAYLRARRSACSRRSARRPGASGRAAPPVRGGAAIPPRFRRRGEPCSMRCCAKSLMMRTRACCAPRCAWCAANFAGARADCAQLPAAGRRHAAAGLPASPKRWPVAAISSGALACSIPCPRGMPAPMRRTRLSAGDARRIARAQPAITPAPSSTTATALKLAPRDDSIRAALADALAVRGDAATRRDLLADRQAQSRLAGAKRRAGAKARGVPSLSRARLATGSRSRRLAATRSTYREAAMLALANARSRATRWRRRARNFEQQRELPDVRVLARAALRGARRARRCPALRQWLRETGYRDSVTESILDDGARS